MWKCLTVPRTKMNSKSCGTWSASSASLSSLWVSDYCNPITGRSLGVVQSFLQSQSRPKTGRKRDLMERAMKLVEDGFTEELKRKIYELDHHRYTHPQRYTHRITAHSPCWNMTPMSPGTDFLTNRFLRKFRQTYSHPRHDSWMTSPFGDRP